MKRGVYVVIAYTYIYQRKQFMILQMHIKDSLPLRSHLKTIISPLNLRVGCGINCINSWPLPFYLLY